MTFCDVAFYDTMHPFKSLQDSGIFNDYVAVIVSPAHVVWLMV